MRLTSLVDKTDTLFQTLLPWPRRRCTPLHSPRPCQSWQGPLPARQPGCSRTSQPRRSPARCWGTCAPLDLVRLARCAISTCTWSPGRAYSQRWRRPRRSGAPCRRETWWVVMTVETAGHEPAVQLGGAADSTSPVGVHDGGKVLLTGQGLV